MAEIKFYRGIAEKYNREIHGDGIYFATNTLQIIHDGKSFGISSSQIDLSEYATKDFVSDSLCGFVKDLYFDSETGEFNYTKRKKVYTPYINDYGEEDIMISYSDTPVKFSIRSVLAGMVKGISFTHSETGDGLISYSQLEENTVILETGAEKTTLVERVSNVEIPSASYEGGSYLNGLMSGKDKETLDNVNDTLRWKSPNN